MRETVDPAVAALDLFARSVCGDRRVAEELKASRADFFGGAHTDDRAALRRHLEWFLLERPSEALGGVPAEVAVHSEPALAGDAGVEMLRALLGAPCGVFEVTSVRKGEGLWVRDLAALGEYPLAEKEGSLALQPGDLIVGRLFPAGEAGYRASPGAGCIRDRDLARALAADLVAARGARRGVVRLSQAELERLFFAARERETGTGPVERARAFLAAAGLSSARVNAVLAELAASSFDPDCVSVGGPDALGRALDLLAFDTNVDLDRARRVLLEAWPTLSAAATAAGDGPIDVRAAMDAFDAGRREGKDLEQLFDELERDLGLAPDDGGEGEIQAPDFPGVVGALIDEYVWERERAGRAQPGERDRLAPFATFAADVGVFDNLGARELLTFATLWLPEFGGIQAQGDAQALLAALRRFCAWAERTQAVALLHDFDVQLDGAADALARLAPANAACPQPRTTGGAVFEVVACADERVTLRAQDGDEWSVQLEPDVARALRPGDSIRGARTDRGDGLAVYCCYPPQFSRLRALPPRARS